MTIYLILFLYLGIWAFIFYINGFQKKSQGLVEVFVAGIGLFSIMALRNKTVGTDLLNYNFEFDNADLYYEKSLRSTEQGYSYFNLFFHALNFNFQSYIVIVSLLFVLSISLLYYLYSKNILLSFYLHITIGLFALSLTGLRQTIAIAFTIFAFVFLMKNKKILFLAFVLVAYTFHNSAIVFLLVYFFRNMVITKNRATVLFACSCILFFLRIPLNRLVEIVTPEKYLGYLEISYFNNVNPLIIIVNLMIPLACLLFWPIKKNTGSEKFDNYISIFFVLACANFVIYFLSINSNIFTRISYYFVIYITILIPNVIYRIKNKEIKIIAYILCIILPLVQFLLSTPNSSFGIDAYKFFWE